MKKIKKNLNFGKAFLLKGLYCLVFILLRYGDSFGQTTVSIGPSNTSTVYYKLSTEDVYSDNSDIVGSMYYQGTYRWYRKAFLFDLSQIPSYAYVTQCQIVFSASVYQGSNPGSCNFALISTDFINWSDYDIWDDINSHTPNTSQWVGGQLTEYKISSNFEGAVRDAVSNSPHELAVGTWFSYEDYNRGANFYSPRLGITYRVNPPAPTGLQADSRTPGSFVFSWASGGLPAATYYKVYVNDIEYGTTTTTQMKICNLSPNTTYQMRVVPYNSNGEGTSSSSTPCSTTASYINGDPLICTSSDFSINNPDGTSVSWNIPNILSVASGYSQYSNPIRYEKYSNGNGYIIASVSSSCENYSTSLSVHAGPYSSSDYEITGPSYAECNSFVAYSIPELSGVTSINWIWPSGWTYGSGQGTRWLDLTTGDDDGTVMVGVDNICGQSGSYHGQSTYLTGTCGYSLIIYPNPASDLVNVNIKEPESNVNSSDALENSKEIPSKMKMNQLKVSIVDIYGKPWKTLNKDANSFTIPISDLKKGNYIMTVTDGNIILSAPFVIAHP